MVNALGSTSNANTLTGSNSTIAENFEQFLGILLAQLQNQNPLEPLDTNQFTEQLVQFTEVEQSLQTNSHLEDISANTSSAEHVNAVNYLGTNIIADGDITQLSGGEAQWVVDAPEDVEDVAFSIYDSAGSLIYQGTTEFSEGDNVFEWDGTNLVGQTANDGAYRVTFDATDATGSPVTLSTQLAGTVTGVDFSGLEPVLQVGDASVPVSMISSVGTI